MLALSLGTVVRMLEFRLGGGTQPPFAGHTDLTDTDFAVLGSVVTPLLSELAEGLSRVKEVTAVPVSQESSVQFVQLAGPNEMFLVSTFQLVIGEDTPAEMILALAFPDRPTAHRSGAHGRPRPRRRRLASSTTGW